MRLWCRVRRPSVYTACISGRLAGPPLRLKSSFQIFAIRSSCEMGGTVTARKFSTITPLRMYSSMVSSGDQVNW